MKLQSIACRLLVRCGVACLMVTVCSGCLLSNNIRVFEKNNIQLGGGGDWLGRTQYYGCNIGTSEMPYDGYPDFRIQLSSGQIVLLRDLTPEMVRLGSLEEELASKYDKGWHNGEKYIENQPYGFTFAGSRLVRLDLIGGGKIEPAIGKGPSGPLYRFPLTFDRAVELFGHPDHMDEHFAW